MKKAISLAILLSLALTGCGKAPEVPETTPPVTAQVTETTEAAPQEVTEASEAVPPETETVPLSPEVCQVLYSYLQEDNQEFYTFQAIGPDQEILWTRETAHLDCTELPQVTVIGTLDGMFCYNEGGTVVALDVVTGEVLWENPEFRGSFGDDGAAILDPRGYLYLTGFYGPDLMVLDSSGKTLRREDRLDPDRLHPYHLETDGETLTIFYSTGPQGPQESTLSLAMDWIPGPQG